MAGRRKWQGELVWGGAGGIAALALVLLCSHLGAFEAADASLQARLMRAEQRPYPRNVVLVATDDESFVQLQYPFPRVMQARVISALTAAGAKVIGLDEMFNPRPVDGPPGDAALARALSDAPHAILGLACALSEVRPPGELADLLSSSSVVMGRTGALQCPSAIAPFPPLAGAAKLGHMQLALAHSDANRGVYLFVDVGQSRVPALAFQMYLEGEGIDRAGLLQEADGVFAGDRFIPTSKMGEVLVSPRRPSSLDTESFVTLLRATGTSEPARFPPELAARFRDKYVLMGNTAEQINDIGHGVTGDLVPLVLMHASFLADLIDGRLIAQAPQWLQLAVLFGLGLLAIATALRTRPAVAILSVVVFLVGLLGGALLLLEHGMLLAPLAPLSGTVLAFAAAISARMIVREQERGILRSAFGSYVDADHLERILSAPEQYLSLGGARKNVTILFSDIQGYTSLSNALPPEEVIGLMREYLGAMTHRVRERGGRVDKIMGDGIMAVFGDPIPNERHAVSAVEVALDMQRTMLQLREQWVKQGKAAVSIRIGVATGEVFVGNIGSPGAKMEYTALGATVNLASRLEGRAQAGTILVSAETAEALGDLFELEIVRGLQLKGFAEGYDAYRVKGVRVSGAPKRTRTAG